MSQQSPQPIDGPRAQPASGGKADSLVILVHGYGADGQDLIGLSRGWQSALPGTAFVAPNGPSRCDMSPMGYQWFPITRLDPTELWRGVQEAAPVLNAFIDQELERHGLSEDQLALVGFSQGTMLSLHVGLRRAKPIAGLLGYSGALAGPEHLKEEIRSRPPVMLIHGDMDPTVPVEALHHATSHLGAADVAVQWHVSAGIGHGIAPDGQTLGGGFLANCLSGSVTHS